MSASGVTERRATSGPPGPRRTAREAPWRPAARFVLSTGAAAGICLAVWARVPRTLSGPESVIGYPIFRNFDYQLPFWAYRLVIYAFPLLAILLYALVAWRGPLRRLSPRPDRSPDRLSDADHPRGGAAGRGLPGAVGAARSEATRSEATRSEATRSEATRTRPPGSRVTGTLSVLLRLAVPATVIIMAVAARTGRIGGVAIAAAAALIAMVLATAWAIRSLASRVGPGWGLRDAGGAPVSFGSALALTNGAGGAAAALLGLWYVSRHTVVFVGATTRHLPWFPLWLAGLAALAALGWTLHQLRRGRDARWIERVLLVTVVGAIGLFLAVSALPEPLLKFQGYDDAQEKVGALLLSQGYFPWRDFLFIHGLFYDGLRGNVGMALFGNTAWGINAGQSVLILPLAWVFLYLFGAWISKLNPWFATLTALSALIGLLPPLDVRFIAVPLTLILLGAALRRRSRRWTAALIVALFVQAVLVPETGLLVIPVLLVVVAADLVDRTPGTGLWRALSRTRWSVITGVVITGLFAAVLAWYGALKGFITYYLVFAPSHNVEGALPAQQITGNWYWFFRIGPIAVLITIWAAVWRIRRRGRWTPADWVALAAAGFTAVYGEKALGRFDQPHVAQVLTAALPLVLFWLWQGMRNADALARSAINTAIDPASRPAGTGRSGDGRAVPGPAARRRTVALGGPLAAALLAVVLLANWTPLSGAARTIGMRHRMSAASDSVYPRLGYSSVDAVDAQRLADLTTALSAYAGNAPIFDMTNSLGYFYYLMGRAPATAFLHVSMAMTPYSQQLLINELEKSRPRVVVFDSYRMGLPAWDGITNNIRHYEVSNYILRNWTPVLRVGGVLLLLRRDLAERGVPTVHLAEPAQTSDLWFSGPTCDWGDIPNFMPSTARGQAVSLPVTPAGRYLRVTIDGSATDPATGQPARQVLVASGDRVVASLDPVASPYGASSGVLTASGSFTFTGVVPDGGVSVYQRDGSGRVHPLAGSPGGTGRLLLPDGTTVAVSGAARGHVNRITSTPVSVGRVDPPRGFSLTGYDLATLSAGGRLLGAGEIGITDNPAQASHAISASVLPNTIRDAGIRVGSCPQWYGYRASGPLYVTWDGGTPITTLTLSGVGD